MMKKMLSYLLGLILLCTMGVSATAASASQFTDVERDAWYYDAVEYAAQNGIMNGVSSSTFAPGKNITRADFVTMLGRYVGVETSRYPGSNFSDVKADLYFTPYINWASANGVISGIGQNKFGPYSLITREQVAKIFYEIALLMGKDMKNNNALYASYTDTGSVSSWAAPAVKWAVSSGLMNGSGSRIKPTGNTTRAQSAQLFMNLTSVFPNGITLPETSANKNYDTALAKAIFQLVNQERAAKGLNPLTYLSSLDSVAQVRGEEISRVFSHTRPDGTSCFTAGDFNGENIYYRTGTGTTAETVMDAWMNSEGHRANILSQSFTGISVACYVKGNSVYCVQIFKA